MILVLFKIRDRLTIFVEGDTCSVIQSAGLIVYRIYRWLEKNQNREAVKCADQAQKHLSKHGSVIVKELLGRDHFDCISALK